MPLKKKVSNSPFAENAHLVRPKKKPSGIRNDLYSAKETNKQSDDAMKQLANRIAYLKAEELKAERNIEKMRTRAAEMKLKGVVGGQQLNTDQIEHVRRPSTCSSGGGDVTSASRVPYLGPSLQASDASVTSTSAQSTPRTTPRVTVPRPLSARLVKGIGKASSTQSGKPKSSETALHQTRPSPAPSSSAKATKPRPLSARPAKSNCKTTHTEADKPASAQKPTVRPTSAPPKRSQPSTTPTRKTPIPDSSSKRGSPSTSNTRTATTKPKASSKTLTTSKHPYDPLLNAQSELDVPLLLIRRRVELALQGKAGDAPPPQVNTRYEQGRSRYVRPAEPSDDGATITAAIKPSSGAARDTKYPIVEVVGAVGWGAGPGGGINTMDWCSAESQPDLQMGTASMSNPLKVFDESMRIMESRLNRELVAHTVDSQMMTDVQKPDSQELEQPGGGCFVEEVGAGIWEVCSSDRTMLMKTLYAGY